MTKTLPFLLALAACQSMDPVSVDLSGDPPELLSEMNLFVWDGSTFTYNDRVVPYVLNTPLFSDYAVKDRAIYFPEGSTATYTANDVVEFPVGTVIIKSFSLPADFRSPEDDINLIETRVLIRYEEEWKAFPYLWNADGTDANLHVQGEVLQLNFIDEAGQEQNPTYVVPQRNQCVECHELKDLSSEDNYMTPIGPKARHLNRDFDYGKKKGVQNQLSFLSDEGYLEGLPALDSVAKAANVDDVTKDGIASLDWETLDFAARTYLDINCAHCHNPAGVNGISSQLFLNHDNEDLFHLGICKKPGSAGKGGVGRTYDIVPGDPEASILVYRTETQDLGAMMPLLGRSLTHTEGVDLLWEWVAQMDGETCSE